MQLPLQRNLDQGILTVIDGSGATVHREEGVDDVECRGGLVAYRKGTTLRLLGPDGRVRGTWEDVTTYHVSTRLLAFRRGDDFLVVGAEGALLHQIQEVDTFAVGDEFVLAAGNGRLRMISSTGSLVHQAEGVVGWEIVSDPDDPDLAVVTTEKKRIVLSADGRVVHSSSRSAP